MIARYFAVQLIKRAIIWVGLALSATTAAAMAGNLDPDTMIPLVAMVAFAAILPTEDVGANLTWMLSLPRSRIRLWWTNFAINFLRISIFLSALILTANVSQSIPTERPETARVELTEKQKQDRKEAAKSFEFFGEGFRPYFVLILLAVSTCLVTCFAKGSLSIPKSAGEKVAMGALLIWMASLMFMPRTQPFLCFNFLLIACLVALAGPLASADTLKLPAMSRHKMYALTGFISIALIAWGLFGVHEFSS